MGTVLVVDDIAGNCRLLKSLLAPDGHVIRTAGDGDEAVRAVRDAPPDLVLMDVMMPTLDGFEACRAIKQDPASRLIPVVLVTALNDAASRIRGIEAGADDFISKPFNVPELRARVRSLLRIKRYIDDLDSAETVIAEKAKHLQEKEQLVEQLRETGEYLENLFDSANAPIIVWNPELRVTRFNRACERLTGYAASEVVGLKLRMLFPADSREESLSRIVHASGGQDRESPEVPILRKDGKIRIALWNSANIRAGDGTAVIATIAQGQDVTERKQAEQMKADFVSFATHQLRTPLSGIRWLLELAEQGEGLPEEVASLVVDARLSAERLIRLVNDLLAVSRIEGGQLAVEPQPVDLSAMTTGVVNELMPLVREKNQQFSLPDGVPAPRVYADPKLVREVVLNLLSNAIKYTPNDGSITVSMKADGDTVQWAVRDTGIGVPVAAERRLFEKFYRAENATVINTEGTGLGLYLVRLVLERLGGRVWCESEEGRGSTFTFTLPIAREGAASEGP